MIYFGTSCLGPEINHLLIVFLATTSNTLFSIVFCFSFIIFMLSFFRFSSLAFWAWGFAPLLIVSHSFNIKFNQPIKQNIYNNR